MSYWYERMSKKYIWSFLLVIPVVLASGFAQWTGSYLQGCIATCSRTVYDWLSPERDLNEFEIYPFVHASYEIGCTEWLGFSTCETVQFTDWMPIWTPTETLSIKISNITNAGTLTGVSQITTSMGSTLEVSREYTDNGIAVEPEIVTLKRRLFYTHSFADSRLDEKIKVLGAGVGAGGLTIGSFMTYTVKQLLGGTYMQVSVPQNIEEIFNQLGATNKALRVHGLYGYRKTHADGKKCAFDDDCGGSCAWGPSCEPMPYGLAGILMPSATILFDWKGIFELNHWPLKAWEYEPYCPKGDFDARCTEQNRAVAVFSPDAYSLQNFVNQGDTAAEKFPDLQIQLWKAIGRVRRVENCGGAVQLGSQGKDCGVPAQYAFVGPDLFVSSAGAVDEISSERVSGLRFDFLETFQINRRLTSDYFLPLFWVERKPQPLKLKEELLFSEFKGYASGLGGNIIVAWIIYTAGQLTFIGQFFWGITCVAYCKARGQEFAHLKPDYI